MELSDHQPYTLSIITRHSMISSLNVLNPDLTLILGTEVWEGAVLDLDLVFILKGDDLFFLSLSGGFTKHVLYIIANFCITAGIMIFSQQFMDFLTVWYFLLLSFCHISRYFAYSWSRSLLFLAAFCQIVPISPHHRRRGDFPDSSGTQFSW